MGIDDIIRFLLFAAFFWPVISGLFKKRQPPPQKKSAPPRSTQTEAREPRRQPSAERPVTGVPKTGIPKTGIPEQSQPQSSFDKRLEEARKRVREAMESGDDAKSARPRRTTTAKVPASKQGAERGLFREPAQQTLLSQPKVSQPKVGGSRQVDVQQLESAPRTFAPSGSIPKGSMANTMGKTSFGEESDPLKVTRLRRSRRSVSSSRQRTKRSAPLLDMSDTSILRGFVWKQILSEPKAKQKANRRTP